MNGENKVGDFYNTSWIYGLSADGVSTHLTFRSVITKVYFARYGIKATRLIDTASSRSFLVVWEIFDLKSLINIRSSHYPSQKRRQHISINVE